MQRNTSPTQINVDFVSLGGLAIDLGDLAQPSQTDYSMGQIGHQQH